MLGEEGKDKKKEEPKKPWAENFRGYEKYNRNGIRILESVDKDHPFDIVIKNGQKKITPALPEGVSPETIDFDYLPNVDEKDYDKTIQNLNDYAQSLVVDKKLMTEWNDFVQYAKYKGYAGTENMNHLDFSKKVMAEYKKDNPDAKINYNHVLPVQQAIHNYRDYTINQFKTDPKHHPAPTGVLPDFSNYMQWAGTKKGKLNDGIVGQNTSLFSFPSFYMNEIKPETRVDFIDIPPVKKKEETNIKQETASTK